MLVRSSADRMPANTRTEPMRQQLLPTMMSFRYLEKVDCRVTCSTRRGSVLQCLQIIGEA